VTVSRSVERALKLLAPLSLIALWQLAVALHGLDARLFPPPSAIAQSFVQ